MSFDLSNYVDVKTRIKLFYEKYPDGSLQFEFKGSSADGSTIWGIAYAYRTPDDPRPATGTASELAKGKTSFTAGSELMNLETSAIGRAIGNFGIGIDAGMASKDEVEMAKQRQHEQTLPADPWGEDIATPLEMAMTELGATPMCACNMDMLRKEGTNPATGKFYSGWVCRKNVKSHNLWDKN